jgi:hypothetical protein
LKDRRQNQPSNVPVEKICQLIPVVISGHVVNSFNYQMSSRKATQCSSRNGFPVSVTASLSDSEVNNFRNVHEQNKDHKVVFIGDAMQDAAR